MSTISRRAFLKTVGVGALSVAAMSVLAGCDVAGTQTPVVDATTIEGKYNNIYKVSDALTVKCTTEGKIEIDQDWYDAYEKEYVRVIKAESATYETASAALKADAEAAAKKKAAYVESEEATVNFTVSKYVDDVVILAESGEPGKIKSSAFTATCNGVAVDCTISHTTLSNTTNNIVCTLALPCNAETFDVTVALPGADSVVKYTFENKNYVEKIDPSKFDYTEE